MNFLLVSSLEDKGYAVLFQNGKVFMCSEGVSPYKTINISVREGRLYRVHGKLVGESKDILDHGSM
jgi:hypothetical protein